MPRTTSRRGEKIGWTGGFLGAFLWALILAIVLLFQGKIVAGIIGLFIFLAALFLIGTLAPWHRPATPYWRLFVPIYLLMAVALGWAIWSFEEVGGGGISPGSLLILPVFLIPFFTAGKRRWQDGSNG